MTGLLLVLLLIACPYGYPLWKTLVYARVRAKGETVRAEIHRVERRRSWKPVGGSLPVRLTVRLPPTAPGATAVIATTDGWIHKSALPGHGWTVLVRCLPRARGGAPRVAMIAEPRPGPHTG